jgi:hypothetical protein
MEKLYCISLNIKTVSGIDTYATYNLGDDKEKAIAIFNQLKGSSILSDQTVLNMDFTEMRNGIPFPITMMDCTFQEVIYNTKIITREIFKNLNLEPS